MIRVVDPKTGDKFFISGSDSDLKILIYEKRDIVLELRPLLKCLRIIHYDIPEFGVPTTIASVINKMAYNYKSNYWNQMALQFDFMNIPKEMRFFVTEKCTDVAWQNAVGKQEPVDYEKRITDCEKMEKMEQERRVHSTELAQPNWISKQEYQEYQEELLAIKNDINIDQELEMLELLCENVADPKALIWSFIFNEKMTIAIKQQRFWNLWNRHFEYKSTIYMLRYTMYILLFEEWVRCIDIDQTCRNIWTLDEAHLLSQSMAHISKDTMYHPFIFLADPYFSNLSFYMGSSGRSIVGNDIFKQRLSYMVPLINDAAVDLQKYHMCLSGSSLLPCVCDVPHQSLFNSWEEFVNYYYSDSDIDLSIHCDTKDEFYSIAEQFVTDITAAMSKSGVNVSYEKIERHVGYKYCIKFTGNPKYRSIDLFHSKRDPVKLTKMYHLAVVRLYYDGLQVRFHSSSVASILSGLNYNFKAGKVMVQSIGNVILKYATRGFATNVTKSEAVMLLNYISISPKWLLTDSELGYVSIKHPFFYRKSLPPKFNPPFNRDIIKWTKSMKHTRFGKIIPPFDDYTSIESAFC